MAKLYGLDVSEHNGALNFSEIKKAGNSFVILRAGYGWEHTDPKFEAYYKQAKAAGLGVGAYFYSYALNAEQAKTEANYMLKLCKGKQFDYPVYIDMEDADGYKKKNGMPSNATLSDICKTFCDIMEGAGYYAGIYASESWMNNQIKSVATGRYDLWIASWGTNDGTLQKDMSASCKMHQFTSEYRLNGKRFDRNVCHYDYPAAIKKKKLNGYSTGETSTEEKPASKYIVNDLVKEFQKAINKDYGWSLAVDGSCGPDMQSHMALMHICPYPASDFDDRPNTMKIVQRKLGGLDVDGMNGPKTSAKVKSFQKAQKLKEVNGVVGKDTIMAICKVYG